MRFDLEHDWQGNMSTPRAKVGERAKTHLLIVLCAIWLCMGLLGHAPWKPLESHSVSIIKQMLEEGQWLVPVSLVTHQMETPPLYYIVAGSLAKVLSSWLSIHDAARLSSGLWMVITLLMIGMTGRELWGKGVGRQTTFVFIGSLGLVVTAHTLTPAVSSLTGLAMGFYAFALIKRRPYRAGVLLGLGMAIAFLSQGPLPVSVLLLTTLLLPLFFSYWRSHAYRVTTAIALLIVSLFSVVWALIVWQQSPQLLVDWWRASIAIEESSHVFLLRTLTWYAWPALPIALWGVWRFRDQLLSRPKFQLAITFFILSWLLIGFLGNDNEIYALPLLIPMTAIAGGGLETLKRGAAGALNWFGLILFGLIAFLVWLGWWALLTGSPAKLKQRMEFLSGMSQLDFQFPAFVVACLVTLIWLFAISRSQHSNRSSATNWAIGMTMVWTLLMTLWLPMIDSARSYRGVFNGVHQALPANFACMNTQRLGKPQQDLLYYYTGIKAQPFELGQQFNCDLYLIQDERGREQVQPPSNAWKMIWQGKRASERRESFRLYHYQE